MSRATAHDPGTLRIPPVLLGLLVTLVLAIIGGLWTTQGRISSMESAISSRPDTRNRELDQNFANQNRQIDQMREDMRDMRQDVGEIRREVSEIRRSK